MAELVEMELDELGVVTNQHRLTDDPAADVTPAFSPSGNRIVFVSDRDGNEEIYTMRVDGTDQRRITNDPAGDVSPDWGMEP